MKRGGVVHMGAGIMKRLPSISLPMSLAFFVRDAQKFCRKNVLRKR